MSIFSVPQKNIAVEICYLEKDGEIVFINNKELVKEELKSKIKTSKAEFAYESWEDFNKTMKKSIIKDPTTGEGSLDPMMLRDLRLRKLLKKVTDGDGNEITVNDKEISNWTPEFCVALMSAYGQKTDKILSEIFNAE